MNEDGQLQLSPLDPGMRTPSTMVDPCNPDLGRFPRFRYAKPIRLTVHEGEMLYLPGTLIVVAWKYCSLKTEPNAACWMHQVTQDGPQGVIAVNYWYDLD